ncbi:ABC-2 type transport system ATP-binding protein [Streptomyces sp. 2132.2]|uniref:ATP-binding cassette domain-containing protein n=1 Tax=Streptomyces sp. 2132.2 TaxID=2485161 RepID=UPI000F47F000|nr:ATP-binding cassette domain-containing protein [Streptomyces sp. 2132.2]ROQ88951.1 ABC-2 type transport system ATP-binding protein [Streptomyces sp. 2132.2]
MLRAQGLRKRYGDALAVDGLSFTVRPGVVTGFLGPNGAGKSTTMRLMLGLDTGEGSTTFDGVRYAELGCPVGTVGSLLDAGAVHPARSAHHHLRMIAAGAGLPDRRAREVLSLVGLDDVRHRRTGGFSLGMRQRLGLATALLGDPEYLILDEPTNGLDPEGVRWMRRLLVRLAEEGRVVFASSHLLSEMATLAEDLVVIGGGRLIAAQPVEDFVAAHTRSEVVVRADRSAELGALLRQEGARAWADASGTLVVTGLDADRVGAVAARHQLAVRELRTRRSSLEDAFLAATADRTRFRGAAV